VSIEEIARLLQRVEDLERKLAEQTQVYTVTVPPSPSRGKPYLCPVCGGSGQVSGSQPPEWGTGGLILRTCHTCGGTGVLWG